MGRGKLSKLKGNEACIARLEMQMIQEEKKKEKQGIKVKEERSPDIQTEILSRLKIMEMLANSKDLCSFDFDKLQEVWTSSADSEFALVDHSNFLTEPRDNAIADTREGALLRRMKNVYIYMAKDHETRSQILGKQMAIYGAPKCMRFLADSEDPEMKPRPAVWIAEIGASIVFGYHDMNVFDSVIKIKKKLIMVSEVNMLTQGLVCVHL